MRALHAKLLPPLELLRIRHPLPYPPHRPLDQDAARGPDAQTFPLLLFPSLPSPPPRQRPAGR